MPVTQLIDYLLGFPKELLLAMVVFFLPMKKKEHWYFWLPGYMLLLLFPVALGAGLWNPGVNSVLWWCLYYVVICTICAFIIRRLCGCSWHEAGYCVISSYIIEHIVYCVYNLGGWLLESPAWWDSSLAGIVRHMVIYGIVWHFHARRLCRDGHYPSSVTGSLVLIIGVFALMFLLSMAAIQLKLEWLHAVYALICLTFVLVSEQRNAMRLALEKENEQQRRLWALNKAQYELSSENIQAINRKSHDLRHQLIALRAMGNSTEKNAVLDEIERAVQIYDYTFRTGSRALDTVLMQKGLICEQEHIQLTVIADGRLLDFMHEVDLYTMAANILDNAIEACRKLPAERERSIHLSLRECRGLILLQEENPYAGTIEMKDGLPSTTKENHDDHGIGTHSIQYTASRYGGAMRILPDNGMYIIRVIFPAECGSGQKNDELRQSAP